MIVLGIESATESVGAAVRVDDQAGAVLRVDGRRRHAESLAPAIREVLEHAAVAFSSLDAIAVDVGPGLFTGLRVGVAMAKGLGQGLGVGVLGVTSLEILAAAAFDSGWPGSVLAVVDARRGEVFAARYGRGRTPMDLVELAAPSRHLPEHVLEIASGGGQPVLACGDGALRYRAIIENTERVSVAGRSLCAPDPDVLVSLALSRLDAGAQLSDAAALLPVYLREPDARINWVQRPPMPVRGA